MLKIIHTGDVHVGAKFTSFGEKAGEQRKSLLSVFAKTVDTAISKKVDLVLIAGDLFDSNFPSLASVRFVKAQLKRLHDARIYTAILPGTHDCLSPDSIYLREDFSQNLSHIFIFDSIEIISKEFPEIDVTIFAKANITNKSTQSPVAFLENAGKEVKTTYKVAMAHGSIQIEGKSAKDDTPILQDDMAKSGMQYIALGHWHGAQDFTSGDVRAWYSGSPEITYLEGKGGLGAGYILDITIADGYTKVNPIQISEKKFTEMRIDMQMHEDIDSLYNEIKKFEGVDNIVSITLFGIINANITIDAQNIEEDFADVFFHLKIKNETTFQDNDISENIYPKELVIGQFVSIMKEKLEQTEDEEEKNMITSALHIGIAELEGKNVIE